MLPTTRRSGVVLAATAFLVLPLAACSNTGSGDADAAEAPGDAVSARPTVPEGTEMTFVVDDVVSTETAKVGDHFMSTLSADVMGVDGRPAVPAGTLGRWTVVQATDDNGAGEALLMVGLDAIRVNGDWHHLDGTVTSTELQRDAKDSDAETAAKVGIGAAAGALAGRVLGGSTGATLKGAGVGAAMGTAVALSTRGASAELREGARITVRLDQGLVLAEQ
jgi:hypothetical protein